jgi:hypothetical protein
MWRLLENDDEHAIEVSLMAAKNHSGQRPLKNLKDFALTKYGLSKVTCVMYAVNEKVNELYKGWGFVAIEGECPVHSYYCPSKQGDPYFPCMSKIFDKDGSSEPDEEREKTPNTRRKRRRCSSVTSLASLF